MIRLSKTPRRTFSALALLASLSSPCLAHEAPTIWGGETVIASRSIPEARGRYRGIVKPRTSAYASAAIVEVATRDIGASGPQLGLSHRAWCGEALNRWRRKAGLSVVPSRRAVDQAGHGYRVARPVPGALMISARKGGGHVDLIAAVHDDGTITVIRPNWSRRVSVARIRPYGRIVIPS